MAIELITGRAGKAHIGSEDDRAYHAYTNGEGRYILNGGTADIESANNVHIDPVEFLVDGAHVRVTGTGEDVAIENGVASYKRTDVIALHYTRTGNEDNYIESVEFAVVKGTNVELGGEAQMPDMPKSGTILTGANDVYVPVYSLLIDGLTPKNLTALLEKYALPVEHGGTGAKTAKEAIVNLGAMPVDAMGYRQSYVRFAKDVHNQLPEITSGDLTILPYDVFIEFFEIEGTDIRGINRLGATFVYNGRQNGVSAADTKVLPAGTIPERFRPKESVGGGNIDYNMIGALVASGAVPPDTGETATFTTLRIYSDGSASIKAPLRKFTSGPLNMYVTGNMQGIPNAWGKV